MLQNLTTKIFGENSTQEEVYSEATRGIIDSVMEGFNATVFAYGLQLLLIQFNIFRCYWLWENSYYDWKFNIRAWYNGIINERVV